MGPLDALWHLLDFFAPALSVGLLGATAAKLCWRRELAAVSWRRLAQWGCAGAALALMAMLVVSGRDGRMLNYGVMALSCALGLWWAGFGRTSSRL
jgi:hypothetical protein